MGERGKPALYTIPSHRAFGDALANGLIRRFGSDPMALARGTVLVTNNRAKLSVRDAFVRASEGGLLLPRLVAIGDTELDESVGAMLDAADDVDPVPPAIDPLQRRMILARLVSEARARNGQPVDAGEAVRLAGDLSRTLDQLLAEEVPPARLREIELAPELSEHWQREIELFGIVLDAWPRELERLGRIDLATRRSLLLDKVARRWRETPPPGFVCAAGIATSSPAVARMLRSISELPLGMVVLPGLATDMPANQWEALGPHEPDPVTAARRRPIETHGQYHLKLLLDRIGVGRGEVMRWRDGSEHDAPPQRGRAVAHALAPAEFTHDWTDLPSAQRRLPDVSLIEAPTPAGEAQAIAIALRETLETPGLTAAMVTPDRMLARRVAAHCRRWGIEIDDSAGQPLSLLPPGTLLLGIAEAAAQDFAPVALLNLLKHPLVMAGDRRADWLDGVRLLDKALRGPRPAAGLIGIDRHLSEFPRAAAWWPTARALLEPVEAAAARGAQPLPALVAMLREAADALAGDPAWARPEGRAAADLIDALESEGAHGPALVDPASLPAMLRTLMDEVAVRPPQGGHPRLAIYGLLEARLQTADRMILGGLNEGVWPPLPAPDPWLAPRIRAELGLPGLERRIGLSAHDFAGAMGAREVMLSRAHRDATAPTIASRFLLRLIALSGGLERAGTVARLAEAIDRPSEYAPAKRPEPSPPVALRPRRISVTEVDRLKADPYAFYARRYLGLMSIDPVDADASAAWRGTAVHDVLEHWAREDGCDPEKLRPRAEAMLRDERTHPMLRALWGPRLIEAIDWIATEIAAQQQRGRAVIDVEREGRIEIAGVELRGKYDRIDRMPDGSLGIVDYKTGQPPSPKAARAGFTLQLGLLGLIAERGGFDGVSGKASVFEYWSLAKYQGKFGRIASPVDPEGKRDKMLPSEFVPTAAHHFEGAAALWLTGNEPFKAKLNPEYAPWADYDQLMRRDEWYGRE